MNDGTSGVGVNASKEEHVWYPDPSNPLDIILDAASLEGGRTAREFGVAANQCIIDPAFEKALGEMAKPNDPSAMANYKPSARHLDRAKNEALNGTFFGILMRRAKPSFCDCAHLSTIRPKKMNPHGR